MKKFFKSIALCCLMAVSLIMPQSLMAQVPQLPQLPVDPEVKVGTLPNGLTYYIRHNEYPKGQADFYIAQNVGSILEEDNQRGLAHFLEHMCFNGTTNFPGSSLRDWLESIGVKFGYNLNAYTSIDETVYNISNVPVARESVQDSCLLILHDWANDLTLAGEEIDKERGVIHEEWRRSNQGQMRILEGILPELFPTTKYGHRLPIGTMEVVDNFPHQALRDYYEKWYRPDQQAVIVVGDIDPARIEAKIKEMFSSIEMPANPAPRTYEQVPDHKGTLYGIGQDTEMQNLIGQMYFLTDPMPGEMKNTPAYLMQEYVCEILAEMLNTRLEDLAAKPDAPFAYAHADYEEYIVAKTKEGLCLVTIAKDKDIVEPLKAVYREALRAQRGGFTPGEYDRARAQWLSEKEKEYNNRATRENETYVKSYVKNFTDKEPIAPIETVYEFYQQTLPMIQVQMINQIFSQLVTADNRAVMVLSPEGEGYNLPTKDQLEAAFAAVDAEEIAPFVDEMKSEPLIPTAPVAGSIVSETHNAQWDATEWTLSNGAKVLVKPTNFKEGEIKVGAYAHGGFANYPAEYANSIISLPVFLSQPGLGTYTYNDVVKYTAGKQCEVEYEIQDYSREISGTTTPKDLPTLMELIYMGFKDMQFTADEFEALRNMYAGALANQESNPDYQFGKYVAQDLYASPFKQALSATAIAGASREQILQMTHEATANAADWTFYFVGNVDPAVLKPLVETYIASLPSDPAKAVKGVESYDPAFFLKTGDGVDTYTTAMTTPQTYVMIVETANVPYTIKNRQIASIAGQILTNRLLKSVREDMGAVYSIGAHGQLARDGANPAMLLTQFPMKPEMKAEVLDLIKAEFKAMEGNITAAELNPAKEYMVKNYTEKRDHDNEAWVNAMTGWTINGVDTFNGDVDAVNSVTVEDVQDYMKALNAAGNYRVVVLDPKQ